MGGMARVMLAAVGAAFLACGAAAAPVALERCMVLTPPDGAIGVTRAADLLCDEIAARTGIRPRRETSLPGADTPTVLIGVAGGMPAGAPKPPDGVAVPAAAEGYALWLDTGPGRAAAVCIEGSDARGALFGAGRLLRSLHIRKEQLSVDGDLRVSTAPRYAVRGHELGYRDKSNTYDAWTMGQYEQYMRDLVVFGSNTVQLVVQLDVMAKEGRHMTEDVLERTVRLAQLAGDYGLRVWIWLAPSEKAITPETAGAVAEHCRALFERCAPIDAVFVPGGDPGNTPPGVLLPLLREVGTLLRGIHPEAELWVSNEDMPHEWNTDLFRALESDQPDWLTGIVFGTWVKLPLAELRRRVPARYPIVQYADVTHCIECQYPVPGWDRVFALTLGREPINPRPVATAHIHNRMAPFTRGFVTYSDGVNDDVNKVVWSAMGWEPESDLRTVLEEYGRYFVGEEYGDRIAQGLLALERNWGGPLASNEGVEKTLGLWQTMEKTGSGLENNWRFQMGLFRAYYDVYVRRKLLREDDLERQARAELARAWDIGVEPAVRAAREILGQSDRDPVAPELRQRIVEIADRLFRGIGMQLSVEKYGAANWERGAVLDALDMPLSDRPWLDAQLDEVLAAEGDEARLARIDTALNWADPGPGGYYDDLGNAALQPHLAQSKSWADDPGFVESAQAEYIEVKGRETWRKSWLDQAQTLFGEPLRMRYNSLDPTVNYRLRITYTGRFRPVMTLTADGRWDVHGPLAQPETPEPLEFPVPREATADGVFELEWRLVEGRGCQVAEVWLIADSEAR